MIDNDRLSVYLNSIKKPPGKILSDIESQALSDNVPIIRKDIQYLLDVLLRMNRPECILEVGSGVGFSAIFMETVLEGQCDITTIENYKPRISVARDNILKAGFEDKINLIDKDALEVLPTINRQYDFVFMDAAKGQYINMWADIKRLTHSGSVIVTDNVMQDGDILESHYVVTRRNRTIHKRMREYLYELCQDTDYDTTILSVGDGVALTVAR